MSSPRSPTRSWSLSNQIADHLKATLDLTLTSAMQLAIADHIQFAMQRLANGQRLEHAMLWELKSTYRREFTAALEMLEMIHAETGVVMPVDEADSSPCTWSTPS